MRALVTGGGGFLGSAIARQLKAQGFEVISFSRHPHPHLKASGIPQFQGSLEDREPIIEATRGCDIIFNVAAKAGI